MNGCETNREKAWVYLCCHPEDQEEMEAMAREIPVCGSCEVRCGDPTAQLTDEDRDQLARARLILFPVTEKLLTTPNAAMDQVLPFARERHIPVLPVVREDGDLELYILERLDGIRTLDATEQDAAGQSPYPERLERLLTSLLAEGTWEEGSLRSAAQAGDPAAWDRLGVLYDMGLGVDRDPAAALAAREEAAKLYRAAAEDPARGQKLLETLEAVEELQNELCYPYEEETRYMETLRELEALYRKGGKPLEPQLYLCLVNLGGEYAAQENWEEGVRYLRQALELAQRLAQESGDPVQRLYESCCHRLLGMTLRGTGKDCWPEYNEALALDQGLDDTLGENEAVLRSLEKDYQRMGDATTQRDEKDLRAAYYQKRVETLERLAELTASPADRTELCYARLKLATVIPEAKALRQLELAMAEGRRLAEETGRTTDWLTLADLYNIRGGFFYESDAVRKEWYGKAEEIYERMARRGLPQIVYHAWLSACSKLLEALEEDDEELEKTLEQVRALYESTDPQK